MFHLTEARPMCGAAIFSQSTSRCFGSLSSVARSRHPEASHARLHPGPLPAARSGAPGGRRSGQGESWERGGEVSRRGASDRDQAFCTRSEGASRPLRRVPAKVP